MTEDEQGRSMKRPQEHEFSSFTAYARALEDYCTSIEQPEPEPVAWINWSALTGKPRLGWECESELASEPLYKSPPKREPLMPEQIENCFQACADADDEVHIRFARAIEAAHGIKGEA